MQRKTDPEQLGTIEDSTTYPMVVFMKKAGIGKHALTMLRKQGLKVIRTGGRAFVRGRDFSEFLANMGSAESEVAR